MTLKEKYVLYGKAGLWAAGVLAVILFPSVAVVAGLTYAALYARWPDRVLAWALVGAAGLPLAAVLIWTDYLWRWAGVVGALLTAQSLSEAAEPTDWLAVVLVGSTAGPVVGAVVWRVTQRRRERDPFNGPVARQRRLSQEERRRNKVVQEVQKLYHTTELPVVKRLAGLYQVPLGDQMGPYLGRVHRGDLNGEWRKGDYVRLPMNHPDNRHLLMLGGTGLGKTETILRVVEWALWRKKYQVIYITCKEPPSVEKSAAPRLAELAARYGTTFRQLVPGYSPYDPMRGSVDEVRDRLIRIEEWGDRYWSHCANLLIGIALELMEERGQQLEALPDVVFELVHTRLKERAKGAGDPRIAELVAAMDSHAVSGAMMRYASMALHLRGWVGPAAAGGWSFEDAGLACIELPMQSRPEGGAALLRLVLRDFGAYLTDPDRRQRLADGSQRPIVLVLEEIGVVAADPVVGGEAVGMVERNRSADAYTVLTGQDPLGLGDERTRSAILTNAATLTYRQNVQAEELAKLAGTEARVEAGTGYGVDHRFTGEGVARMQDAFKANPQLLRELGQGEFVVVSRGHYLKASAAMGDLAYGLPASEAVAMAQVTLEQGRQYCRQELQDRRSLPVPRTGHGDATARKVP